METRQVKLAVGFITYGKSTPKYLPYFLESLNKQTFKDFRLFAIDNTEGDENESIAILKKNPMVEFERSGINLGFAKAHNRMIAKATESGCGYYLAINTDVILDESALDELMKCASAEPSAGSISPKIFKWDFKDNKKTGMIDSFGIKKMPGLRFVDLGQGKSDKGQFDNEKIIGPSGAAALYRLSALEKIKEGKNYFDENMFMYKEDCDIAYRLMLAGFTAKLAIKSSAYHDRNAAGQGEGDLAVAANRLNKSRRVKEWSFLNQHIIFLKFWHQQSWNEKISIIIYALKMFFFVLLFEQYLLKQYKELYKIRGNLIRY